MFKVEHLTVSKAELLSDCWDDVAGDNFFLRRESLKDIEEANKCGQQYHMFLTPECDSIVITYKLALNIFSFSKLSLKIPVTIIGIPCSVSRCGFKIGEKSRDEVFKFLQGIKGAKIILNSDNELDIDGFTRGSTLPDCRLELRWNSFEQYLEEFRSHYRYRIRKALEKWPEVKAVELGDNSEFDRTLYNLYLEAYHNSPYKLEKLEMDFFRKFPSRIIKFMCGDKPLAFIQLVENGEELVYLFGGLDYSQDYAYDIRMNMMIEVVKLGITGGFKVIEMGQNFEEAKLRLGCTQYGKYFYASHSSRFINNITKKCIGFLSYKAKEYSFNVFKGGRNQY